MVNDAGLMDWADLGTSVGIPINDRVSRKLESYLDELLKWNRKFNLTGIKKAREIQVKNFQDSMAVSRLVFRKDVPLVDIGSGAGFPGLVIKIIHPSLLVYLVEPNRHRYNFLCHVKRLLDLDRVITHKGSIESWLKEFSGAWEKESPVFISRALRKPELVLSTMGPKIAPTKSSLILMLGSRGIKQLHQLAGMIRSLDLRITGCHKVLLSHRGGTRINVLLSR